jgi:hypothetical protein
VLGTGLKECILSGLLSVDRLKVRTHATTTPASVDLLLLLLHSLSVVATSPSRWDYVI